MNYNNDTGLIDTILVLDTTETPPVIPSGYQPNVLWVKGTGALTLPSGTTVQQPGNVSNPQPSTFAVGGMLRYNTGGFLEYYNSTIPAWVTLSTGGGSVTSITVTTDSPALEVSGGSSQTITTNGTFALTLASTLNSLGNLATSGLVVNNAGTVSAVTIDGTAGNITVANGNGTAGNPTINLATVTPGASGSFDKFTTDSFGRVVDYTPVTLSDITGVVGTYYLPESGGTMSGAINMGGNQINDLGMAATPAGTDATNVNYVQSLLQGLSWKEAVAASTTTNLGAVYNNGASGVGATLTQYLVVNGTNGNTGTFTAGDSVTASPSGATAVVAVTNANAAPLILTSVTGTPASGDTWTDTTTPGATFTATSTPSFSAFVTDGYTASIGDRILVKNQSNQIQNGIYVVTATGSAITPWVLTRSTDTNTGAELFGAAVYVDQGTVNENTGWTQTTPGPLTIGTSNITWAQFSGTGAYTAGTGLTLTGNTFSLTSPVAIVNGGTNATTAQTAFNNLSPATVAGELIYFNGTNNVALPIGTTGEVLTVASGEPAWGTNAITLTGDTGSGTVALGGTLTVNGTSNYITTTVSGSTYVLDISATYPGQTSITTLGTVTTGTWNASIIGTAFGGTGLNTSGATNGQLLIGNGTGLTLSTLTAGTAISVVNGVGSITINNTGVTSAVAGTGISVSSATGAVTISNTGVTSFQTSLSGLTPSTATTGAVTLAGVLGPASGGTGVNNGSFTITLGGNITTGGSFTTTPANNVTLTTTGPTNVTLPTSGTLVTTTTAVTTFDLTDTSTTPIYNTTPSTPTSGAIAATITLATQSANLVFAGPASGGPAQPTFRSLTSADVGNVLQLYRENPSTPVSPIASGTNAVAQGSASEASQYGSYAWANGGFSGESGSAQAGKYIFTNTTTNATSTELFLDGVGTEFIVPNNSVVTFSIFIAARRTDATGGGAGYKFEGSVRKDTTAASVSIIGNVSTTILGETNPVWTATVSVNATSGALTIFVQGEASKTIRWVAVMQTAEVTN